MTLIPGREAVARHGNTSRARRDDASQRDTWAWERTDALHRRLITAAAARRARSGRRMAKPWRGGGGGGASRGGGAAAGGVEAGELAGSRLAGVELLGSSGAGRVLGPCWVRHESFSWGTGADPL